MSLERRLAGWFIYQRANADPKCAEVMHKGRLQRSTEGFEQHHAEKWCIDKGKHHKGVPSTLQPLFLCTDREDASCIDPATEHKSRQAMDVSACEGLSKSCIFALRMVIPITHYS